MPLYDYECQECGPFVSFSSIEERSAPSFCPVCGRTSRRVISAPNLCLMASGTRKAHAVNERSQHAPRVSRGHQCSSSCGCGTGTIRKKVATTTIPKLGQFQTSSRKSPRPWMLGH